MNLKELLDLYLVGNRAEHVPPLRIIATKHVAHFDKKGKRLHDMRAIMRIIKAFAEKNGVWKPENARDDYWNSKTVVDMWDGIYQDLVPYLLTVTQKEGMADSTHKSKPGNRCWRTVLRKMKKAGL